MFTLDIVTFPVEIHCRNSWSWLYSFEPLPKITNRMNRERTSWWLSSFVIFLGLFAFQNALVSFWKTIRTMKCVCCFLQLWAKSLVDEKLDFYVYYLFIYLSNSLDPFSMRSICCSTHIFGWMIFCCWTSSICFI